MKKFYKDLLPFYAILRSIPNKGVGVIAIFASLLILISLPFLDTSRVRGAEFRPLFRFLFWMLVADFWMLMQLGALHVEPPYIFIGQIATAFYFAWFLILLPAAGILDNSLLRGYKSSL